MLFSLHVHTWLLQWVECFAHWCLVKTSLQVHRKRGVCLQTLNCICLYAPSNQSGYGGKHCSMAAECAEAACSRWQRQYHSLTAAAEDGRIKLSMGLYQ